MPVRIFLLSAGLSGLLPFAPCRSQDATSTQEPPSVYSDLAAV